IANKFVLPEPWGPTTTVSPGLKSMSTPSCWQTFRNSILVNIGASVIAYRLGNCVCYHEQILLLEHGRQQSLASGLYPRSLDDLHQQRLDVQRRYVGHHLRTARLDPHRPATGEGVYVVHLRVER